MQSHPQTLIYTPEHGLLLAGLGIYALYDPCLAKHGPLRHPRDAKTVAWMLFYAAATLHAWHADAYVLYLPLLCYFAFASSCITHNSMHSNVFAHTGLEQLWRVVLTIGYGHPCQTFLSGHNLSHHRFTQTTRDPMRTTKVRFQWHFLNLLLFQPMVAGDVFRQDLRFLRMSTGPSRATYAAQIAALLILRLTLLSLDVRRTLVLVFAPCLFAQWGIVTMNLLQHDGCTTPEPGKRDYNMARNFVGPVINFLAFNNGYHTIHHFFPTMHWSRLPEEHERQIAPHILPELDERCMARYILRTFFWPGRRVDMEGADLKFADGVEPADDDWTEVYFEAREEPATPEPEPASTPPPQPKLCARSATPEPKPEPASTPPPQPRLCARSSTPEPEPEQKWTPHTQRKLCTLLSTPERNPKLTPPQRKLCARSVTPEPAPSRARPFGPARSATPEPVPCKPTCFEPDDRDILHAYASCRSRRAQAQAVY